MAGCEACACSGVFDTNVESHVDVPITLDGLEDWASERDLTAETGMLEREGTTGSVSCGHSPACLIIIPFIVADAVLPPMLKHGSVTDDEGVVWYSGVFDLRGRLLRARVRVEGPEADEGVYREIARLDLPELGEHPIVELARVRVDSEGNELERSATPLLEQVDLLAMYAEALAGESSGGNRADLVVEELQQLGAPGLAAVEARYDALDSVDDEELVQVLHEVCHGHARGAELMVRVTAEKGGMRPVIKTVLCLEQGKLEAEHFVAIAPLIVDAACSDEDVPRAFPALITLGRHLPEAVAERAGACTDEVRRLHLLFHAGQRPSDEDLERILREDEEAPLLVGALSPRQEEDRRVLVAALDAPPALLPIARALQSTASPPTTEELRRAATVFAGDLEGPDAPESREWLLRWMGRADEETRTSALGPLRDRGDEPHNAAALVYLASDHDRLAAALRGFEMRRVHWRNTRSFVSESEHTFVAHALQAAGCDRSEIEAAAQAVRAGTAPSPCSHW